MSEVTVLGIFVADLSFSANKIPTTGETILGDKYNIGPGGKGCNQAIALARLGCNVNFISKIGDDDYGKLALNSLEKFLIFPHHRPNVLKTLGKSLGPTKIIINAAMTKYSTPPTPGNINL